MRLPKWYKPKPKKLPHRVIPLIVHTTAYIEPDGEVWCDKRELYSDAKAAVKRAERVRIEGDEL